MKLRVFYITHTEPRPGSGGVSFKKTKRQMDFPEGTSLEEACDAIYEKHGRMRTVVDPRFGSMVHSPYAEIVGCTHINDEREIARLDVFTAHEQSLLTGQMLKDAIGYSPNYKKRRKAHDL